MLKITFPESMIGGGCIIENGVARIYSEPNWHRAWQMKKRMCNSFSLRFGVEGFIVEPSVGKEVDIFGLFFHCP